MVTESSTQFLSAGTHLRHYMIEKVLGVGGFGITYRATDSKTGDLVAIKEFLPTHLAQRTSESSVSISEPENKAHFEKGLRRFRGEAQTLAGFRHDNIVRVQDTFEDLGTAYIVMEYIRGFMLSRLIKKESQVRQDLILFILFPILDALGTLHSHELLHRDIKPDNILLREDFTPVLIDFGAARHAVAASTRWVTAIYTPGYAPLEQYTREGQSQGPWSDLYALGATLYRSIAGRRPVDALQRKYAMFDGRDDPLLPAQRIGQGQYDETLLEAIDWMLEMDYRERPQSVPQLVHELNPLRMVDSVISDDRLEPEPSRASVREPSSGEMLERAFAQRVAAKLQTEKVSDRQLRKLRAEARKLGLSESQIDTLLTRRIAELRKEYGTDAGLRPLIDATARPRKIKPLVWLLIVVGIVAGYALLLAVFFLMSN